MQQASVTGSLYTEQDYQLYRRCLHQEGKRPQTVNSYCRTVNYYMRSINSGLPRGRKQKPFTPENLAWFLAYLKNVRRNRQNSISSRMSALASYCGFLVQTGHLKSNPVLILRKAMNSRFLGSAPRDSDQQKLIQYLRSQKFTVKALRNLLVVELICQAGLTPCEISRLDIRDVHFRKGLPSALVIWKGRRPRLVIIRDSFLTRVLHLHLLIRNLQVGSRLIRGRSGEAGGFCPISIARLVRSVFRKAGLACNVPTPDERIYTIPLPLKVARIPLAA